MEEESASLSGGYPQQQPSSSTNSHSHQNLNQPFSAATIHSHPQPEQLKGNFSNTVTQSRSDDLAFS